MPNPRGSLTMRTEPMACGIVLDQHTGLRGKQLAWTLPSHRSSFLSSVNRWFSALRPPRKMKES